MNQELLSTTITFFKEQHGTYEVMRAQMLAGGIKEEEIGQIYGEIQRLGLDPAPQVAQAQTPPAQGAVSVASLSPFLANTAQGTTFGVPITPSPLTTAPSTALVAAQPKSHLPIFLTLIIVIGAGLGGTFAYAYYNPESSVAKVVSQTLQQIGLPTLLPVIEVPPLPIVVLATSTIDENITATTSTTTLIITPVSTSTKDTLSISTSTKKQVKASISPTIKITVPSISQKKADAIFIENISLLSKAAKEKCSPNLSNCSSDVFYTSVLPYYFIDENFEDILKDKKSIKYVPYNMILDLVLHNSNNLIEAIKDNEERIKNFSIPEADILKMQAEMKKTGYAPDPNGPNMQNVPPGTNIHFSGTGEITFSPPSPIITIVDNKTLRYNISGFSVSLELVQQQNGGWKFKALYSLNK
jgi:hypothetical protein